MVGRSTCPLRADGRRQFQYTVGWHRRRRYEEIRAGGTGARARAWQHHGVRDQEVRARRSRPGERQGRHAVEVASKRTRSGRRPTKRGSARSTRRPGGAADQKAVAGRTAAPTKRTRAAAAVNTRADAIEKASKRLVYEVVLNEDKGNFKFGRRRCRSSDAASSISSCSS